MLKSATLSVENSLVGIDRERAKLVIETSLTARESRQDLFIEVDEPPERRFIELIKEQGDKLKDPRFPLNALVLTTTLVFGQRTADLFGKITDMDLLEQNAWLFIPERVVEEAERGIIDVTIACSNYFRPAGYPAIAIKEWVHNCRALNDKYNGDVREFFRANDDDAVKVVNALVVSPRAKTRRKEIRRLGVKLARLFVQWVHQYGLYDLKNVDEVGLPVDWQLGRIFIQTGALLLEEPVQAHTVAYKVLLPLLTEICEENGWEPQRVSETIWLIGSNCCSRRRHDICPVSEMCDKLISRTPYDKDGKFDPTDVGRFD